MPEADDGAPEGPCTHLWTPPAKCKRFVKKIGKSGAAICPASDRPEAFVIETRRNTA